MRVLNKGKTMSYTEYSYEPDPKLWEMYLSSCRALEEVATTDGYSVWLDDNGYDGGEDEVL